MKKCLHCIRATYCRKHSHIQLIERDLLHPVMWINPHIHKKYRPLDLPWTLCIKSIFQINNETINIWSHLIGFVYIGFMQYWCAFHMLPSVNAPLMDYIVMAGSMLCSQICMALSSAYHTFGCQSAVKRQKWLKADLFGVSLALLGIYLSGIYTSFYHFPEVQRTYSCCLTVILVISLSVPIFFLNNKLDNYKYKTNNSLKNKKNDEIQTHSKRIGFTHFVYIGLGLFGLYPTWHWLELNGGFDNPHVVKWFPTSIVLFSLIGFAFFFYATLIPECFFPGKFDVIGCSHQWWHLLILAALVYWHDAGVKLLAYYHTNFASDFVQNSVTNNILFNEIKKNNLTG